MLQKINNAAKFIVPLIILGSIAINIFQNRNQVLSLWKNFEIFPLLIAFVFMLLIYLEAGFNWHILIRNIGFPLQFKKSLYIFIVSNASRYIPGSIWQYIGRVELAKRIAKIPRKVAVLSLILEVLILINAGLVVSLLALPFFEGEVMKSYVWIFLLPLSLVFLHPKIIGWVVNLAAKITKKEISKEILNFNFKNLVSVFPFFILNFFLNGIALFFLVKGILPEIEASNILLFSGIFAFSWIVGYLSVFAPAGLGVSDFLLAYLLSFQIPFAIASTIALFYRLLLTIAELVIFMLVMRLKMKENNSYQTKDAWEKRSKKYGFKVEGVATKSLPPVINNKLDEWMLSQIKKLVSPNEKISILDLGCGYGRLSKPLLKEFTNIKTFGLDISKTYVSLYNKDLSPRGKAVVGDIKKLPYKSNSFDIVFIVTTLMYLTNSIDQQKALKEIMRVLKPGGKVAIIERSPSGYFLFTFGGLVNLIRGRKYQEIPAVSIQKNDLKKMVGKVGGVLENTEGIPFLSLFMPYSIILNKLNQSFVERLFNPINYLDEKLAKFLWPSLYLSYTISKSSHKK